MDYRKKCEQLRKQHDAGKPGIRSLGDLFISPDPEHGDTWRCWTYNAETLVLSYTPAPGRGFMGNGYEVDLERPGLLPFIFHVADKGWISVEDMGNLIFALSDLMFGGYASYEMQKDGIKRLLATRFDRQRASCYGG